MRGHGPRVMAHGVHPIRRSGVKLSHTGDLCTLDAADGERLWVLNESALALWELCDGETSLDEMVDAICCLCNISAERAITDVDEMLGAFTEAGLLRWSDET